MDRSRPGESGRHAGERELLDFKEIGREPVGVEVGSVGGRWLWNEGYLLRRLGSQQRILERIAGGDLRYGLLWPNAGWLIAQDEVFRESLRIQLVDPKIDQMRWNMAVAVSRRDRELLPGIDAAILKLARAGRFEALFAKYEVPYFNPFEDEAGGEG